jgi:hypothetical protein
MAELSDEFEKQELIVKHFDKKGSSAHHMRGYKRPSYYLSDNPEKTRRENSKTRYKKDSKGNKGERVGGKKTAPSSKKASPSGKRARVMQGGVDVNEDLGGSEESGMKLLSASARKLHPRAQVSSLKRIATRALGQAERKRKYSGDEAGARKLDKKAKDALAAMQKLNRDHKLGYGR